MWVGLSHRPCRRFSKKGLCLAIELDIKARQLGDEMPIAFGDFDTIDRYESWIFGDQIGQSLLDAVTARRFETKCGKDRICRPVEFLENADRRYAAKKFQRTFQQLVHWPAEIFKPLT